MEDGKDTMNAPRFIHLLSSIFHPRFLLILTLAGCAKADAPPAAEHPYPGITLRQEVRKDPDAQRLFWATIDLADPHVSLHVSRAGPDPDGEGKWPTPLMPPRQNAQREGFELTVNGDFFVVKKEET